jgi:co-chaperonin GroES (HSP10)
MNLEMLEEQLLLDPDKRRNQTASGIIIPEAANTRAPLRRGCVVACGPGRFILSGGKRHPMKSIVGDVVWYSPLKACYVEIDGKSYVVTDESSCVGIERDGDMPEPKWEKGAVQILSTEEPRDEVADLVSHIEQHGSAMS